MQNNGKFTEEIAVEKSVHQGGCISVQLFLLCAETIALELRQCDQIEGIPIEDFIYTLNQYADDMSVASLANNSSISAICDKIEHCRLNTDFAINFDKTVMLRLGLHRDTEAKYYTQKEVAWTSGDINILGIVVSRDNVLQKNYDNLLNKAKSTLGTWKARGLSLMGKVLIIHSLVASLFVYKMAVLPLLPRDIILKFESLFANFIWNGRKAKIALNTLKLSKSSGGLNLIDLRSRDLAIKTTWVQTLQQDPKMANLMFSFLKINLRSDIWKCNLSSEDLKNVIDPEENAFWHDVLFAWHKIHYRLDPLDSSRFIWAKLTLCG